MTRKSSGLLRNVISAAGQVMVQMVAVFLLYRHLIEVLGIERLGVWSVVLASTSAARLTELGLGGSITRFVARFRSQGDETGVSECIQTAAISLAVVLGAIALLLHPLLVHFLPHILPVSALSEATILIPYALLSLWLTAISNVWTGGIDGCLRSDLRARLAMAATLAYVVIALASVRRYGLVGLAAAQAAQGAILLIGGWLIVRRLVPSLPWLPARWYGQRFREMLGYGVNFQINSAVMLLFEPTTKILLGRYGELSAAGYFELAQRLIMKVRALIVESNRVIVPVFAGTAEKTDEARNLYARNVQYLFFVVTPLFACLLAVLPGVSELWIRHFDRQFVSIAIGLTLAWYVNSMSAPAYFAFLGQGKLRWLTFSHVSMGSINLILGLTLGQVLGWQGIIVAFICSLVVGSVMTVRGYHMGAKVKVADILAVPDLVYALVCCGAAVAALLGYVFAGGLELSLWVRVGLVPIGMAVVVLVAAIRHPLWSTTFGADSPLRRPAARLR